MTKIKWAVSWVCKTSEPTTLRFELIDQAEVNSIFQGVEEDPLNSNDDQSDDEDLETLFQADNVIVCQFEKVNRARTKWVSFGVGKTRARLDLIPELTKRMSKVKLWFEKLCIKV